ncbi:MAG TPA: hypothetical protein VGV39_00755 [Mesorhizobium sp.]|jgi:hypothetical protein|uniref:hypothetical protein n=1 Tax=Mesorhizobium sp. TaxID=1871066 RepID=UPI002DDCB92E|nr:hypothetical protein [Mesorhizobium sp.]HEV2501571.1 hypothetical protein [Mesorhizobium sp.]
MPEAGETVTPINKARSKLSEAVRDVKNALADRDDVVVDLREAHRMRLELLASELSPVFADVPSDVDFFDFALSSGLQPRLWIDAVSHIAMGRDRRTYRFVKDTRLGRVVLAESQDMKVVGDQVTRYVAERLVERQRLMEGGIELMEQPKPEASPETEAKPQTVQTRGRTILGWFGLVLIGVLAGLAVSAALFWDRLLPLIENLRP